MKQVILLWAILLSALAVQAQNRLLFEETVPDAYLMRHTAAGPTGSQVHLNAIIDLLNKAQVSAKGGGVLCACLSLPCAWSIRLLLPMEAINFN